MAIITPTTIHNRQGVVASSPAATTNTGPTTGDIGASGTTPKPAALRFVCDVTLTSTGAGDTATFVVPQSILIYAPGIGLDINVTPQNDAARTGDPVVDQITNPQEIVLTFAAAAAGAIYRVSIDAMHSITR